ncbi:MAG TPA: polyphosphate polymerase domain-containing protein [Bdellovibrionales bacterium]|nr:polyphosphate polymerase domain-containing protein [Bdellovibrionales bacterium]
MSTTPAAAVSPLFLERYELKYLIPLSMVDPICKFISGFCEMDYYSQISPDGYYTINSLYLDSPQLYFYRQKEAGLANRFSMRIRSYGDEAKPPYFFETKYKVREFVKKKRGKVSVPNWPDLFTTPGLVSQVDESSRSNVQHFLDLAAIYNTEPQILTQYRRRAFLSTIDDYARVTFDRDLRYQPENTFNVIPDDRKLSHYDHPDSFLDPGNCVILELKCERKIPVWLIDLIQHFELTRGNFSKYGNSMLTQYLSFFSADPIDLHPAEAFAPLSR